MKLSCFRKQLFESEVCPFPFLLELLTTVPLIVDFMLKLVLFFALASIFAFRLQHVAVRFTVLE